MGDIRISASTAAALDQLAEDVVLKTTSLPEFWAAETEAYNMAIEEAFASGMNVTHAKEHARIATHSFRRESRRAAAYLDAARIQYDHLRFMVDHPIYTPAPTAPAAPTTEDEA